MEYSDSDALAKTFIHSAVIILITPQRVNVFYRIIVPSLLPRHQSSYFVKAGLFLELKRAFTTLDLNRPPA